MRFLKVPDNLAWANWGLVLRVFREIWACTQPMLGRSITPAVLGSELWRCAEQANPLLRESEVGVMFSGLPAGRPEVYPDAFANDARRLLDRLGIRIPAQQGIPLT